MLAKMNFRTKLLILLLAVAIIPLVLMGGIALWKAADALENQAFAQLESMREVKKNQVLRYFQTIRDQIITFSEDQMIVDAMIRFREHFHTFRKENKISPDELERMRRELYTYYAGEFSTEYRKKNNGKSPEVERYFRQLDDDAIALQHQYIRANKNQLGSKHLLDRAEDRSLYSTLHGKVHPIIRNYHERFGYYDIFLIDSETGDIVYSVFKELDYSTSLINGSFAQTNFGEAFRKANAATVKDAFIIVDFAKYFPSYEAPAGFIASPIFDGRKKVGVAIFQFPIDTLNAIMGERPGMGKSGETYLVGFDKLLRSDSYLDPEHRSVAASFAHPATGKVDTTASQEALAGKTDTRIIADYRGKPALSAYTPIKMGDTTWALIAEIDVDEAFAAIPLLKWILAIVAFLSIAAIVPSAFIIVRPLLRATAELNSAAEELQVAAQQQTTSTEEQVTATDEISVTMEELLRTSQQISAATANAASGAESANQVSTEGMISLKKAIAGTSDIGSKMENITQNITALGEKTQQMNLVIDIINELADQTTILSFNASIEAAGAGEAGVRFAAVAEQIMNLANKAVDSTKEIRFLIEDVQKSTNKTVLITEEGMKAVDEGRRRIQDTASHFETILKASEDNMVTAKEVEMTGIQQTTAIGQATEAVKNVQLTAENVKSSTKQTLDTAQWLLKIADGLAKI